MEAVGAAAAWAAAHRGPLSVALRVAHAVYMAHDVRGVFRNRCTTWYGELLAVCWACVAGGLLVSATVYRLMPALFSTNDWYPLLCACLWWLFYRCPDDRACRLYETTPLWMVTAFLQHLFTAEGIFTVAVDSWVLLNGSVLGTLVATTLAGCATSFLLMLVAILRGDASFWRWITSIDVHVPFHMAVFIMLSLHVALPQWPVLGAATHTTLTHAVVLAYVSGVLFLHDLDQHRHTTRKTL
eukprot:TRINITY_DN18943_c0_g1_i1.p1 TRINITY_DN18943_c0_g1~~TRINITY_DN18943_c0_g1_i1.p1  ORF type:complete len:255 (-),score=57.67 TRINITY_DN18943_c0_g1_i1:91-813(-)